MRLVKARVQNYRSIKDTGEFSVEALKTILVGPNEAGKTVVLQALQQLHKPEGVEGFNALRDYPRSMYNDITTGRRKLEDIEVVKGWFELSEDDKVDLPEVYKTCIFIRSKNIDNKTYCYLENVPQKIYYNDIKNDVIRLSAHIDKTYKAEGLDEAKLPSIKLNAVIEKLNENMLISNTISQELKLYLDNNLQYVEEGSKEEERYNKLQTQIGFNDEYDKILKYLESKLPVFVLFNNYFKVKPSIHLEHLANRVEQRILDNDKSYDYGNLCLLKFLGFSVRELSNIGKTQSPSDKDFAAIEKYKAVLDNRSYQLNAASVRLTEEIKTIWNPSLARPEAEKIRISADGQYLKVVVEDDLGVEIELDQRSEGFQWLVSFFIVFFAEAMDKHKNAILLLDEPDMSLHGLKQRDFRETLSRLAEKNQTIYTTHSPFLVGPNELDIVRVVELKNRKEGTKVHTTISSSDPAGLLPLQEALGYDLAQSLFTQQKNLILEGLTDYWYIEAVSSLLRDRNIVNLDEKIALIFANSAGKVVYYATILHAHNLKIAALLDSDSAGDKAAQQDTLVHAIGNKNILRTKDYCSIVTCSEIEDLLRKTLINIVKDEFSFDMEDISDNQLNRPVVDIFNQYVDGFSKYKLAKAFVRWTRIDNAELSIDEITNWTKLIQAINKALK